MVVIIISDSVNIRVINDLVTILM